MLDARAVLNSTLLILSQFGGSEDEWCTALRAVALAKAEPEFAEILKRDFEFHLEHGAPLEPIPMAGEAVRRRLISALNDLEADREAVARLDEALIPALEGPCIFQHRAKTGPGRYSDLRGKVKRAMKRIIKTFVKNGSADSEAEAMDELRRIPAFNVVLSELEISPNEIIT